MSKEDKARHIYHSQGDIHVRVEATEENSRSDGGMVAFETFMRHTSKSVMIFDADLLLTFHNDKFGTFKKANIKTGAHLNEIEKLPRSYT